MILQTTISTTHDNPAEPGEAALRFMQMTARLLLEYSTRAEVLKRQIDRLAKHFGDGVLTVVGYRDVTLLTADNRSFHAHVPELRINVAVSSGMLSLIDDLCANQIGLDEANRRLQILERTPPNHAPWLLALIFGVAASALAWLLRADWGAIAVSGASAGLGVIARQELGKHHVMLFALPFAAAFIGAVLGGIVIRLGLTETPGLCLIVPALMLVPGPHLIHSIENALENHMQSAMNRMLLAVSILVAAGLGILLGARLTLGSMTVHMAPSAEMQLTLPLDVTLAGLAACGFGAFYNSPWRVLWVSILCGMVGHGIRYVSMDQGLTQGVATLLACLAIGVLAGLAGDRLRLPFAAIAFAGAVPMMPGVFIYQSFAGSLQMAAAGSAVDPTLAATTMMLSFRAAFIVGAMAIGLLAGARIAAIGRPPGTP
jgi:uncharacterized membrane protein YjjP (DUF1212 family)